MPVLFVIIIRGFNSCPLQMKYQGEKQELYLGKLNGKCGKDSVKVKHLERKSLELACLVTIVNQCLSQWLACRGH